MAQNTAPIFILTPNTSFSGNILTANTAVDGTGTVGTVFTAGANGSYAKRIRAKAAGTNVATVARIFINNGSTPATATNNVLIAEITLPATTASNSIPIGPDYDYPLDMVLSASSLLLVCIGTTVASGWNFMCEGGNY